MVPNTTNEKDKLDFNKIKKLCSGKDNLKKVRRQPTKWDKLFANTISDKSLTCRIHNKP